MAEKRRAKTFQLKIETCERLDEQSRRYCLYGSELADLLLQRALGELEAGRWKLKTRPVQMRGEW